MESEVLCEGRWMKIKSMNVVTRNGSVVPWMFVERTNKQGEVDCVDVIATIERKIVLTAVYRFPVAAYVLEFPSGLTEGLTVQETAIKELKEETGYTAGLENITYVSPCLFIDPWKSTEATRYVCVDIPNIEANLNPVQELEDDEQIIVELVSMDGLLENVIDLIQRKNYLLESSVYLFSKGLQDTT